MRRALVCVMALFGLTAQLVPAAAQTVEPIRVVLNAEGPRSSARSAGPGDATVVAVIDFTFAPYHWDYVASKMPQATDGDRSNDLPLDKAPDKWLPGFPDTSEFTSYKALDLSLEEKNQTAVIEALDKKDKKVWEGVKKSEGKKLHYYWMPDTKVIGAIDFGGNKIHGPSRSHGTGTSSVSVGNIHGTCPSCLMVFLDIADQKSGEAALSWAMKQPWIDAITNSYGFSLTPVTRDRLYSGSNVKLQKQASERGQTIFFSAGNGQENAFLIPNTTLFSSQEGPDWIVTVGAVSPGAHASYTGHGKPADIASLGSRYPAAYGSPFVGGTGSGGFGGTSNATPVIAGTYANALYQARQDMAGPSRLQSGGLISRGRFDCGGIRRECELGDGKLTAEELRQRLFEGAEHTNPGMTPAGVGALPPIGEDEYLNEGHGSYFARESGEDAARIAEFRSRLYGPLTGFSSAPKRPKDEREWMIVDSFCRQHLWGSWSDGYYVEGKTKLPGRDLDHPLRSAIETTCPTLRPLP
ncbi:MAG: S8/S53 family peptidase [Actinomycetota bacterium]|nr:S8/S53 family peptidase [Actinomycetota bacterium]